MTYTAYGLQGNDSMTVYEIKPVDKCGTISFLKENCLGQIDVKDEYKQQKTTRRKRKCR